MLAEERRQRLLESLAEQGKLETASLAQSLGVSEMTIRRDLAILEKRGLARRVYGGARITREAVPGFAPRLKHNPGAKRRIGALAARQVRSNETIYLDAGTTCIEIAHALKDCDVGNVNVLTHAINIAAELAGQPGFTVIQVGGEVYAENLAATGPLALTMLSQFSFDRMFLGAVGLHPRFGVTSSNLLEVAVKSAALHRAAWVALVLDSSKWNRQAMKRVAGLGDLDLVVSDDALPYEARRILGGAGVEVLTG